MDWSNPSTLGERECLAAAFEKKQGYISQGGKLWEKERGDSSRPLYASNGEGADFRSPEARAQKGQSRGKLFLLAGVPKRRYIKKKKGYADLPGEKREPHTLQEKLCRERSAQKRRPRSMEGSVVLRGGRGVGAYHNSTPWETTCDVKERYFRNSA